MKTLEVYPTMTLAHLQHHFTEQFPYLRIVPIGGNVVSGKSLAEETLNELSGRPSHWCFLLEGDMAVAELESDFMECFGLAIHVNRWTGYAWHDTDDTRHWTLNQQNQKGAEAISCADVYETIS